MIPTELPAASTAKAAWITVAHLLRPQGRKGELLAELLTDFPERFDTQKRVYLAAPGFTGTAAEARPAEVAAFWLPVGRNEGRIVLHLVGSDSIESAEKLMGLDVLIPESERLELDDDVNYVSDLIGCTVYDQASGDGPEDAVAIGTVSDVQFPTTPDGSRQLEEVPPLLEVEGLDGEEILIPFAKHFLISVDVSAKKILMRLPDGLLEIYRAG
ncbi:MAG TPA: ribosome maturation factor RimM [Granulicella sp.]|jgi:16S rRNA processing protein RimM|nr:ribosome maturation factor RimM [Granulicella sp.]